MIILDTHIWLNWILLGEASLCPAILDAMGTQSTLAVSAISCFEVALLTKQGKIELPLSLEEWLTEALGGSGVTCLPITCDIAHRSVALTNVHKDPADRIIIATAIAHDGLLASMDSLFPFYPEITARLIGR